jgi:hypothetical protein
VIEASEELDVCHSTISTGEVPVCLISAGYQTIVSESDHQKVKRSGMLKVQQQGTSESDEKASIETYTPERIWSFH